jgi:hypothetical protein
MFGLVVIASCGALSSGAANAQSQQGQGSNNAGTMWGTSTGAGGSSSFQESASMHATNGTSAGIVNAARAGALIGFPGSSLSIQSIGSETIISNQVNGNNISANITANQTSSNSGAVSNNGSINTR